MHDEPKEKPTFEDIVRELGYDKMAFFCDMVRPDQHEEREEDANLPTAPCCHSWSIERRLLPYDTATERMSRSATARSFRTSLREETKMSILLIKLGETDPVSV